MPASAETQTRLLRVCATPSTGFFTLDGEVDALVDLVAAHGGNYTLHCDQIGQTPKTPWPEEDSDKFPVTGFNAEYLLDVVAAMGSEWECVVHILPSWPSSLYATVQQRVCDVSFMMFGMSASRSYCSNESVTTFEGSKMTTCPERNPATTWENNTAAEACCAVWGIPDGVFTIGGLVLREPNLLDTSSAITLEVVLDLINIMTYIISAIIIVAHIVWLSEKTEAGTNTFARDYVRGIFDAIWAVTTGFGGVDTTCGKLAGMVFIVVQMMLFALLAGTLSAVISAAALQTEQYRWSTLEDLPASARGCVTAESFIGNYESIDRLEAYHPTDELANQNPAAACLRDLEDGTADVVMTGEMVWRAWLQVNETMRDRYQLLLSTTDEMPAAIAFSGFDTSDVRGYVLQAQLSTVEQRNKELDTFFYFEDDEEGILDDDEEPFWASVAWPPVTFTGLYIFMLFTASMLQNAQTRKLCICVRLFFVCKNIHRESKLHRDLDVSYRLGVGDLEDSCREIFEMLDTTTSGFIREASIAQLSERIALYYRDDSLAFPEKDLAQVKQLVLEIYNTNLDGKVYPDEFLAAFGASIYTQSALGLLQDVAWELQSAFKAENELRAESAG